MVAASESFEALAAGVQGAFWELGGVSEVLRSDNLSAATHDLRRSRGRALTRRYRELLDHYDLRASLIQVGEAHETQTLFCYRGFNPGSVPHQASPRNMQDDGPCVIA
jgi:hypothetical protein